MRSNVPRKLITLVCRRAKLWRSLGDRLDYLPIIAIGPTTKTNLEDFRRDNRSPRLCRSRLFGCIGTYGEKERCGMVPLLGTLKGGGMFFPRTDQIFCRIKRQVI
jgi:hypothetical protein